MNLSERPKIQNGNAGFTLLEVLIAFAIITIVASIVYISQSSSLFTSVRTKNMLIAGNLARNFLAKTETELAGKEFTVLKELEEGDFPDPYKNFRWKREIKEQDFSALSGIMEAAQGLSGNEEEGKDQKNNENQEVQRLIIKIFQNYLKDSLRKVQVTILWKEDGKERTLMFSTLLVRYDAEFRTTE